MLPKVMGLKKIMGGGRAVGEAQRQNGVPKGMPTFEEEEENRRTRCISHCSSLPFSFYFRKNWVSTKKVHS